MALFEHPQICHRWVVATRVGVHTSPNCGRKWGSEPGTEVDTKSSSPALIVQQICRGPFSALSKPILATKHSICGILQDLQDVHLFNLNPIWKPRNTPLQNVTRARSNASAQEAPFQPKKFQNCAVFRNISAEFPRFFSSELFCEVRMKQSSAKSEKR